MVASDQRPQPRTATARVHIVVRRDQFPPVFTSGVYNTGASENAPDGNVLMTVIATDRDLRVSFLW